MNDMAFLTRLTLILLAIFSGYCFANEPANLPLESPNPKLAVAGTVYAIAEQADGGAIVAGAFESINGVPRKNIARRMPDGGLDLAWNADVDGAIHAVAIDDAGAIFIGGKVWRVAGVSRSYLAKLAPDGTLESQWNPQFSGAATVLALEFGPESSIYVGGNFDGINGAPHRNLARLSTTGVGLLYEEWFPQPDSEVHAIAISGDGSVFVGGHFLSVGGLQRSRLAKLSSDIGQADVTWDVPVDDLVSALAVDGEDRILVGGDFPPIGKQGLGALARLLTDGSVDLSTGIYWPGQGAVHSLAFSESGELLAGGSLRGAGESIGHIRKFDAEGQLDVGWFPSVDRPVRALAFGSNGSVLAGGSFAIVDESQRLGIAEIGPTGALGAGFDAEMPGTVSAIAVQPNGGVIVGGKFAKGGGLPRQNILRIAPGGHVDPLWNPSANDLVSDLAVDGNALVYAAGAFANIGGINRARLARLDGSGVGAADPGWISVGGGWLADMFVDGDGTLYAGGWFTHVAGLPRPYVFRSSRDGAVDTNWNPPQSAPVTALARAGAHDLYVASSFSAGVLGLRRGEISRISTIDATIGPDVLATDVDVRGLVSRGAEIFAFGGFRDVDLHEAHGVAKILGDGSVDRTWSPDFDGGVAGLVIGNDGYLYLGGAISFGKETRRFTRLRLSDASVDPDWEHSADWHVTRMVRAPGGRLYAGGEFREIDGVPRAGFTALDGDGRIFSDGFD